MKKANATPQAETKVPATGTVRAILKQEAPFDVLEWQGCAVGKHQEVDAPADIVKHRSARFLSILS